MYTQKQKQTSVVVKYTYGNIITSKRGLRPPLLRIASPSGQGKPSITIWVIAAGLHCLGIVLILFALTLATVMHLHAHIHLHTSSCIYTILKVLCGHVFPQPIRQCRSKTSLLPNSLLCDREMAFSRPEH